MRKRSSASGPTWLVAPSSAKGALGAISGTLRADVAPIRYASGRLVRAWRHSVEIGLAPADFSNASPSLGESSTLIRRYSLSFRHNFDANSA